MLVLNGPDHKVLLNKSYNTYHKEEHSANLVKDFEQIPAGSVIIAAVKDDASRKLTDEAR